jgi:hypothetical protein
MNSERRYFMDDSYLTEEEEKNLSRDVVNILDLFRLLSVEEKATVKRIIRNEKII